MSSNFLSFQPLVAIHRTKGRGGDDTSFISHLSLVEVKIVNSKCVGCSTSIQYESSKKNFFQSASYLPYEYDIPLTDRGLSG